MSTVSPPDRLTLDQFLAIPPDDKDRELIDGEIREKSMTRRNRFHARCESKLAHLLWSWLDSQASLGGAVYSGEIGVVLTRNPDTNVGIDVAYFSADTVANQADDSTMIEGVPVLAIEILSPSDQQADVVEKVNVYLRAGVASVWIVDPNFRTVTVHHPDHQPVLFNMDQQIASDPKLPALQIRVRDVF